jgi:hypothetical protein
MRRKDVSYSAHTADVSCPEIDKFQTAMCHGRRAKGFFLAFDDTEEAPREIDHFFNDDHAVIAPGIAQEILRGHIARKVA